MNKNNCNVRKFAYDLRISIWKEIFNLPEVFLKDPLNDEFLEKITL